MLGWFRILGLPEQEPCWEVPGCPSPCQNQMLSSPFGSWAKNLTPCAAILAGRRKENLNHSESLAAGKIGCACLCRDVLLSVMVFFGSGLFLGRICRLPLSLFSCANWSAGVKRSISGSAVGTSRTMNTCSGMSWQGDKD